MDSRPPKRSVAFRGASATLPRAFRADPLSETVAGHVGHPLYLSFKHTALPRAFRGHHAFRGPFRDLPRNLVHLFTPSADNNNVRCKVPMLERLKKTQLRLCGRGPYAHQGETGFSSRRFGPSTTNWLGEEEPSSAETPPKAPNPHLPPPPTLHRTAWETCTLPSGAVDSRTCGRFSEKVVSSLWHRVWGFGFRNGLGTPQNPKPFAKATQNANAREFPQTP